jgi:hypothetical protein
MKLDKEYSATYSCPDGQGQLTYNQIMGNHGVCPLCGQTSSGPPSHHNIVAGKWLTPNWWEWIVGVRSQFIPKGSPYDPGH